MKEEKSFVEEMIPPPATTTLGKVLKFGVPTILYAIIFWWIIAYSSQMTALELASWLIITPSFAAYVGLAPFILIYGDKEPNHNL